MKTNKPNTIQSDKNLKNMNNLNSINNSNNSIHIHKPFLPSGKFKEKYSYNSNNDLSLNQGSSLNTSNNNITNNKFRRTNSSFDSNNMKDMKTSLRTRSISNEKKSTNLFALKRKEMESNQNEIKQKFTTVQKTVAKRKREEPVTTNTNKNYISKPTQQMNLNIHNEKINEISGIEPNIPNYNNRPQINEDNSVNLHHNHSHSTYNYDQDEIKQLLLKYDNPKTTSNNNIVNNINNDDYDYTNDLKMLDKLENTSPIRSNNNRNNNNKYNELDLKYNYSNIAVGNKNSETKNISNPNFADNNPHDDYDMNNINHEIGFKMNNLASIEDNMKRLNDILDFSNKSSLKNRYELNFNIEKRGDGIVSSPIKMNHELDNSELVDLNVLNKVIKNAVNNLFKM